MKHTLLPAFIATFSLTSLQAATVTPQIDYNLGSLSFFAHSDGTVFSGNSGFTFYGTFDSAPNGGLAGDLTAQQIEDDFNQLGLPNIDYNTATFSSPVEETLFEGRRGYLVVTNNADIGSATEFAIITNSVDANWTFANELNAPIFPVPGVTSDGGHTGTPGAELVYGSYSGAEIRLAAIPEPSSVSLLGLGGVALILRRKK